MIKFSSQAFFSACRTPGRILLASKPPDKAHFEEAPLANPFAMIGRCDRADIIRNDNDVSWWHAYVQLLDGSAFIMDLGSESGVYVDGRPQGYGWIKPGHIFQIAKHWFQLEGGNQPQAVPDYNPLAADSIPTTATLDIVNNRGKRAKWPLNRRITLVGKAPDCKVRLHSPGIAPYHCSIVATTDGFWVVDLCRRPGILLNQKPVRFARLDVGDEIEVGLFRLYLRGRQKAPFALANGAKDHAAPQTGAVPVCAPEPVPLQASVVATPDVTPFRPTPAPMPVAVAPLATAAGLPNGALTTAHEKAFFEQLLAPVVNHFNIVQQQMFDQFHQTLMTFLQMFNNAFKEQYELIREELTQVHKLTEELESLRKDLAALNMATAAAPLAAARHDENGRSDHQVNHEHAAALHAEGTNGTLVSAAANGSYAGTNGAGLHSTCASESWTEYEDVSNRVLASEEAENISGARDDAVPDEAMTGGAAEDATAPTERYNLEPAPVGSMPATPAPAAQPKKRRTIPTRSTAEVHSWLCQRIDTVQEERRSRWQKIVRFLSGGKSS